MMRHLNLPHTYAYARHAGLVSSAHALICKDSRNIPEGTILRIQELTAQTCRADKYIQTLPQNIREELDRNKSTQRHWMELYREVEDIRTSVKSLQAENKEKDNASKRLHNHRSG